ncbi:MAG TPA: lipid-binding SYLF domain-containing protein [Terriglobales bacterium]|nr:lipid-binding SYLF domain-containing protein [Terriglobales bacterium]
MRKLCGLLILALTASFAFADAKTDSTERLQNAGTVLNEIMAAPDKGIPGEVFDGAKCVVVIPHMVKGGFVFGGKHGRGVATCRTGKGWSAPAFVSIGGGNWGLQIGVQGVDLVMMIMNDKGAQAMLANKFQVGGDASVAAGPVGRHASAGTDWKADTAILSYSRTKGVFAGLTLEGSIVQQDDDSTLAIYGKHIDQKTILDGSVPAPAVAASFLSSVRTNAEKAKAQ